MESSNRAVNAKGQPVDLEDPHPFRKDRRIYCEAQTEASQRAGSWGGANQGCSNLAIVWTEDGHAACRVHQEWDRGWR